MSTDIANTTGGYIYKGAFVPMKIVRCASILRPSRVPPIYGSDGKINLRMGSFNPNGPQTAPPADCRWLLIAGPSGNCGMWSPVYVVLGNVNNGPRVAQSWVCRRLLIPWRVRWAICRGAS